MRIVEAAWKTLAMLLRDLADELEGEPEEVGGVEMNVIVYTNTNATAEEIGEQIKLHLGIG